MRGASFPEASRCFVMLFYGAELLDIVAVALGDRFHRPNGELDVLHVVRNRVQLRELFVHALLAFKKQVDLFAHVLYHSLHMHLSFGNRGNHLADLIQKDFLIHRFHLVSTRIACPD